MMWLEQYSKTWRSIDHYRLNYHKADRYDDMCVFQYIDGSA